MHFWRIGESRDRLGLLGWRIHEVGAGWNKSTHHMSGKKKREGVGQSANPTSLISLRIIRKCRRLKTETRGFKMALSWPVVTATVADAPKLEIHVQSIPEHIGFQERSLGLFPSPGK
jgi:hypothetical protein